MKHQILKKILFTAILSIAVFFSFAQSSPSFYPNVEGWQRNNNISTYNKRTLFSHIDGGAPVYLELNFKKLYVINYYSGLKKISVEVYKHKDEYDATAIYFKEKDDNAEILTTGTKSYIINDSVIAFQKSKFYVKIFTNEKGDYVRQVITAIAEGIIEKID